MCPRRSNRAGHRGFTLIEALVALVILSFAVVALMALMGSGTRVNAYGKQLSTAVFLLEQTRANLDQVAFADLPSYNGQTLPVTDSGGQAVADFADYQQQVTVTPVNPDDMSVYAGADPQLYRVTATVSYQGDELSRVSWLRNR